MANGAFSKEKRLNPSLLELCPKCKRICSFKPHVFCVIKRTHTYIFYKYFDLVKTCVQNFVTMNKNFQDPLIYIKNFLKYLRHE